MKNIVMFFVGLLLLCPAWGFAQDDIINLSVNESYVLNTLLKVNRVQIGNPEVATVKVLNAHELMLSGKDVGETDVRIWDKDKQEKLFVVRVGVKAMTTKQVAEIVKQVSPDGSISFTLTPQRLLLTGTVPNASRGERLEKILTNLDYNVVNMITVSGQQQVQLFVRVAEVVKGNPMRAGVSFRDKRDRYGVTPPGNLGNSTSFLVNADEIMLDVRDIIFPHNDAFQIGVNPSGTDFYGVLSLMEGHHIARLLAQPTLVVESGKSASFLAGGEIPIPVAQDNNTISIEWKEFGVILDFSPVILEDNIIAIKLNQEVSALDWSNGIALGSLLLPAFTTRNTETSVKVRDGESFVISGLLNEEIRSTVDKVPFLGDIPILGALFRSSAFDKNETELAVVVSAKIVSPIAAGNKITMPGEKMTNPGFWEAFFLGKEMVEMDDSEVITNLLQPVGLETP